MLGEEIKSFRLARHMTQEQLARKLDVTKQAVSNWENSNIQPSVDMVMKIAALFHTSTDYLLGLSDTRKIDAAGLTNEQTAHLEQLADDFRRLNG